MVSTVSNRQDSMWFVWGGVITYITQLNRAIHFLHAVAPCSIPSDACASTNALCKPAGHCVPPGSTSRAIGSPPWLMRWNDNSLHTGLNRSPKYPAGIATLMRTSHYSILQSLMKWSPLLTWASAPRRGTFWEVSHPWETTRGQCEANFTATRSFWNLDVKGETKEGTFWEEAQMLSLT